MMWHVLANKRDSQLFHRHCEPNRFWYGRGNPETAWIATAKRRDDES